jgi:hypothetical protein
LDLSPNPEVSFRPSPECRDRRCPWPQRGHDQSLHSVFKKLGELCTLGAFNIVSYRCEATAKLTILTIADFAAEFTQVKGL